MKESTQHNGPQTYGYVEASALTISQPSLKFSTYPASPVRPNIVSGENDGLQETISTQFRTDLTGLPLPGHATESLIIQSTATDPPSFSRPVIPSLVSRTTPSIIQVTDAPETQPQKSAIDKFEATVNTSPNALNTSGSIFKLLPLVVIVHLKIIAFAIFYVGVVTAIAWVTLEGIEAGMRWSDEVSNERSQTQWRVRGYLDKASVSVIPFSFLLEICSAHMITAKYLGMKMIPRHLLTTTLLTVGIQMGILCWVTITPSLRRYSRIIMIVGVWVSFFISLHFYAIIVFQGKPFIVENGVVKPEEKEWSLKKRCKAVTTLAFGTATWFCLTLLLVTSCFQIGNSMVFQATFALMIPIIQFVIFNISEVTFADESALVVRIMNLALLQFPTKTLRLLRPRVRDELYWTFHICIILIDRLLPRFLVILKRWAIRKTKVAPQESMTESGEHSAGVVSPDLGSIYEQSTVNSSYDIDELPVLIGTETRIEENLQIKRIETEQPSPDMSKRMSSKYSTAISEPKTSLMAFQSHGDGRLAPELASNSDLRGQGKRVSAVRFSVHNSGSSELPMPDSASNREQTELTSSAFGSRTPLIHENTGLDAASTRRSRKSVIADTAQRAMAHAANTLMQEYSRNDYTMSSNLSTLYGITCSLLLYDAERSNLSVLICGGIFWAIEIFSELLLVIIETKNGVPIGPVRTFSGMLFIGLCFGNATYYVAAYAGVNNLYGYVE